jgi:hypothetical protein
MVLGPKQPVLAWVPGAAYVRVKQLGRQDDRLPQLASELRISGVTSPLPNILSWLAKKITCFVLLNVNTALSHCRRL